MRQVRTKNGNFSGLTLLRLLSRFHSSTNAQVRRAKYFGADELSKVSTRAGAMKEQKAIDRVMAAYTKTHKLTVEQTALVRENLSKFIDELLQNIRSSNQGGR